MQQELREIMRKLRITSLFVTHDQEEAMVMSDRIALLRNQHTPLARALEFAQSLPAAEVRQILQGSRLPANIKTYVMRSLIA